MDCVDVHVTVVDLGLVDLALEFEDAVFAHFFVIYFSGCFGPGESSRVVFGFEMFVAFWSAESKTLAVVSYEHHPMARIDRTRTEVTLLNPHNSTMKNILLSTPKPK